MDYRTNIWHQRVVAILGTQNPSLRIVYAHIANYTIARGAWCGSPKELAQQIELPLQTVRDQLKIVINKGLVNKNGNTYTATVLPNTNPVQENTNAVPKNTNPVQNNTAAVQIPTLINEIKTMEINEKNARANMRDANPENNPSFDELLKAFKAKAGNYQIADSVLEDARRMWSSDQYSDWKRRLLIRRISEGKWLKSRFDWTVSDFDPKPEFLSGIEQEDNWRANIPMVQVKVNGSYRICTLQTQQDFDLVLIQPWLKKED